MKKAFLIFFVAIFFACDNEIEINEDWRDIPVIYAILDSGSQIDGDGDSHAAIVVPETMWDGITEFDSDGDVDDQNNMHFVRVQKSFLGSDSPNDYIDISDSIYYNSNDLDVWVEHVDVVTGEVGDSYPLDVIDASDLEFLKDDGDFHANDYYLFKLPTEMSDLCVGDCDKMSKKYRISVLNNSTGVLASAETNIVEPISLGTSRPADMILSTLDAVNNRISFSHAPKNIKSFSVILRFNYLEQSKDDYDQDRAGLEMLNPSDPNKLFFPKTGVEKKFKELTLQSPIQIEDLDDFPTKISFYGSEILTFLTTQFVNQNEDVYRYPLYSFLQDTGFDGEDGGVYHRCIDIYITAVNLDFYNYLEAGQPVSGLNQERPSYSNVENGIGNLSSRSQLKLTNMKINNDSQNKISKLFDINGKALNFACYNKQGQSFQVLFGDDCN